MRRKLYYLFVTLIISSLCIVALIFVCNRAITPYCAAQTKQTAEQPPKVEENKREAPKDGMVYVWPLPSDGHQSLIVLNVIDGNTVDAAYLVPVRIRLHGVTSPELTDKNGKEAKLAVDKYIGGQLRASQLFGTSKNGVLADFWITSEDGKVKSQWLSSILIEKGLGKKQE